MRIRLLVSIAIGISSGAMTWFLMARLGLGAADFNWAYDAARDLVAHRDPYAATLPGIIPYPLPAALFAVPFSWLPRGVAAGAFFGTSSAVLAFGLTRNGFRRLLVFLSYPYWAALITAQWTPLLAASACFQLFLPLTLAKPHIGIPVAGVNLSRRGLLLSALVLASSFVISPTWLQEWVAQLSGYQHFYPILVFPGILLALALFRYRDRDAQLLLLASIVPQRWFYDQFILFLIPKSRRELVYTTGLSWIPGIWRWFHTPRTMSEVGLWAVLWLFLPMLVTVLLRKQPRFVPFSDSLSTG
jgi:hypothetical protein